MNSLKKLAGQTAIYGVSSIAGRLLNYLLVPIHTSIFLPGEYGIVNQLYAWVALLMIIYTYGMETAYFRFATKADDENAYHNATTSILLSSIILSSLVFFNATSIAGWLDYPDQAIVVRWLAFIMFIDATVAIPFARLRLENKALKFVSIRVGSIVLNVLLNIVFLIVFRDIDQGKYLTQLHPAINQLYQPELGIGYIFLANLMANAIMIPLLIREFLLIRLKLDRRFLRPMLAYSIPILFAGLAGMVNEQIDKILFTDLLPDGYYPGKTSLDALGVYAACFKFSVFMSLGIQAFRYAGEPFFFSQSKEKESPQLFARVMHYFVVFNILILLGLSINIDLLGALFLSNPEYWEALYIVPIFLLSKLFFGIYVNLSIWYKLTDRTIYGTYITLIGALVTIAGNFLLVPWLGYLGPALASLACYLTMSGICLYLGRKYYPIPYRFQPLIGYLAIALVIIYLSFQIKLDRFWLDTSFNLFLSIILGLIILFVEKKKLERKKI